MIISPQHKAIIYDWMHRHAGELALAVILVLVVYGQVKISRALTRVCELTGPHDYTSGHPITVKDEVNNICISHEPDDSPVADEP